VNLDNQCPFWAQEALCKNPGECTVCECEEHEVSSLKLILTVKVPQHWRIPKTSPVSVETNKIEPWETEESAPVQRKIEWHVEDQENDKGVYVDLKKNQEKYTGYQGQRVWNTIYSENCFKGTKTKLTV